MKIYANPGSGSACIEATLAELEVPYERILVDYTEDGVADESYININPRRQIPAVVLEDGNCLTETLAILMHLADSYPESKLAPISGTIERTRLNQWMSFILANIYEGELRKNYPHRYVKGDAQDVEQSAEEFVLYNYSILEQACGNDGFFMGKTLTILDIYIWMFINWFEEYEELESVCPKIIAIAEKVMSRPKIKPVHKLNFGEGLGWQAM